MTQESGETIAVRVFDVRHVEVEKAIHFAGGESLPAETAIVASGRDAMGRIHRWYVRGGEPVPEVGTTVYRPRDDR